MSMQPSLSKAVPAKRILRKRSWQDWDLYVMLVPGIIFFLLFRYLPMWGIIISFQDYNPFAGIWKSAWVGLEHFRTLLNYDGFWQLFRNSIVLSLLNLVFYFPMPIIIALMLNEVRKKVFKNTIQSIIYMPHFISWVVVAGITVLLFGTQDGIVNDFIVMSGSEPVNFLTSSDWFRTMIVSQSIWKEAGWGTIIFLAALSGVDPQLYEASIVDGAGRWRQLWHITLPSIRSTILILLILRVGSILDNGFEQILLMLSPTTYNVGDVFETYVYREGLVGGKFSYTTAVGLFKSVIGLVMVMLANHLTKRFGEEGVY
ncbi:ABC transporter permease [Paenibacillus dakarensis]|uniref:ABC transporter permease n=1 Tax=Paenibacillus dakarensis TaxID=1527293 RepID=UPI0006D54B5D|nr:sugar ABC transporter permease [Paenibacillus dakarensis]